MGMFGYMTDTETVEPIDTVEVESEGESLCVHHRLQVGLFFEIYRPSFNSDVYVVFSQVTTWSLCSSIS